MFEDPGERLLAIHHATQSAKEMREALAVHKIMGISEAAPPRMISLASRMYSLAQLDRNAPPPMNVIVSNVHGPRMPLYADGGKVVALRSMGPLAPQQGLNFTAWSYMDDFAIGIHACREHVPDIHVLTESFGPELESLKRAAADARKTLGSQRAGAA